MKITPVKRLNVTIVPSWLNELVTLSPDLCYSDLLSYDKLLNDKARILTDEQIFIYVITQNYLNAFTHKNFSDQQSISAREDNAAFIEQHLPAIQKVSDKIRIEDHVNKLGETKKVVLNAATLLSKEFYQPLLVGECNLLLIGSLSPIYTDKRAYYNALLEEVSKVLDMSEFKSFELFKHYLRESVV